jgi:hypothetical protein
VLHLQFTGREVIPSSALSRRKYRGGGSVASEEPCSVVAAMKIAPPRGQLVLVMVEASTIFLFADELRLQSI